MCVSPIQIVLAPTVDEQTPARIIYDEIDESEASPAVYGEADEEHLED